MTADQQSQAFGKIVARAWADPAFKAKLIADPIAVLTAEGAPPPAGVSIKVLENTDSTFNFVIPAKPADLSDTELDNVAGGMVCICACFCCGT